MISLFRFFPFSFIFYLSLIVPFAVAQEPKGVPVPKKESTPKKDPALDQYYVANAAFNRKLYPVAVSQFEAFLEKNPAHSKADLAGQGLALSLYALKQYEKAMPRLDALLKKEKLDPKVSRERLVMLHGQCLMISGKRVDAKALFLAEIKGLTDKSYRGAALAAICDVSFGEKKWLDVEKWAAGLITSKPGPEGLARVLYQQGYAKYQLKKPQEAVQSLVGIAALEANKLWSTRANYILGECYNLLKEYGKAEQSFLAAMPSLGPPESTECHYRLGITRFTLKKYSDSIEDLGKYIKDAPEGKHIGEATFYIARAHLEEKNFEEAGTAFASLSAGEGSIAARASLWHARVFARNGKDYDKASEILEDAADRFAESEIITDLRFDYANALMGRKAPDWKSALALLGEVQKDEKFSQLAELLVQKSVCQQNLADYENSLSSIDEFISSFPEHPLKGIALFSKAENLFLLKKIEEAGSVYADFLSDFPQHSNKLIAQFRIVQINHGEGQWEECLKDSASLQKQFKDNPLQELKGPLFAQLDFIMGDCSFRLEQWEEAIAHLEKFSASNISEGKVTAIENLDTALMQLAVAHSRQGDDAQSLSKLKVLVDTYPGSTPHLPLALAEQGRIAFESGDYKAARTALEGFLEEDKKMLKPFSDGAEDQRPRVMYYLGWVDSSEAKHESAAANFAKVLDLDSQHPLASDAALQQGVSLVNVGDFKSSSKHLLDVIENYPKHAKLARVIYYAGISLARQSQWDSAAVQFSSLIENYPSSDFTDRALYELAWCNRSSEKIEEAVELYQTLLKEHPKSSLVAKVQSELAEMNLKGGNIEEVIDQLTEALEGVKDEKLRADIRYQLASAHLKAADYKIAAVQFEEMLKDYPESKLLDRILFNAGECRLKLGEMEPASIHFTAASGVEGSPDALSESVMMRLGETQSATGKHSEAKITYAGFLERFKESRWRRNASFGLAYATDLSGNSADAIPLYKALVSSDNVDLWTVRSRYQVGLCYMNLKKYEEALVEFVNLEINYPQYPNWQAKSVLGVGRILLEQKKTDQAIERFKEVLNRYKDEEAISLAQNYLEKIESE